jgi:biotin operon repressor
MKPAIPSANSYLSTLRQGGRYLFTSKEASAALGASRDAVKLALNRLRRKGEVASPARDFYVIVPPEYRSLVPGIEDKCYTSLRPHASTGSA